MQHTPWNGVPRTEVSEAVGGCARYRRSGAACLASPRAAPQRPCRSILTINGSRRATLLGCPRRPVPARWTVSAMPPTRVYCCITASELMGQCTKSLCDSPLTRGLKRRVQSLRRSRACGHHIKKSKAALAVRAVGSTTAPQLRPSQPDLLSHSCVRGHRSVIMFGVLVVVLCPDRVAGSGFGLGEFQIPLIVSLRALRTLRLGAGTARCPALRADSK
jgi:hypothetical protein